MDRFLIKIRILPRWIIIVIDIIILFFSSLLAYLLRFNFDYSKLNGFHVNTGILIFTGFGLLSILITRSYAGIVRYTGLQDAGRILLTVALASALTTIVNYLYYFQYGMIILPASVIIIAFFVSVLLLFAYRLSVKQVFTFFLNKDRKKDGVLIYGTGRLAMITRQIIENDSGSKIKVVAFLEENRQKVGKVVNGIRIFDVKKDLGKIIIQQNVKELIISDRSISLHRKNMIVDECLKQHVKVRLVPPVENWVKGELSLNQIKNVNIEELLERESIKLDNYNIREELSGKRVWCPVPRGLLAVSWSGKYCIIVLNA